MIAFAVAQVPQCQPTSAIAAADLGIKILSLLVAVTSVVFVYRQIKKTHDWNRRKATQDLGLAIVTGAPAEYSGRLKTKFGVQFSDATGSDYAACLARITTTEEKAEFELLVQQLLNFNETIAISLKNHIFDEDMLYEHYSLILCSVWTWAQPRIRSSRAIDPTIWIEQEHFASKWQQRSISEIQSLRKPGKQPT